MREYFDIDGERLDQLTSQEAVIIMHQILHAEASIIGGVDQSKISVPSTDSAVMTSDGGIDAEVLEANPDERSHGIIKQGRTSYQIKTGGFAVNNLAAANKIIKKDRKKEFKPRVESCLKDGGTLIVVLFGSDNPDTSDDASVQHIRNAIAQINPAYVDANIEVWHQNNLVGFLRHFPSIRLRLQRQPANDLHSIHTWSRLGEMRREMVIGVEQEALIRGIQEAVSGAQTEPLRMIGDPGVGKTRTALEALKDPAFASRVIYATSPSALPAGLLNRFLQEDNGEYAILVVDECDPISRGDIWNSLRSVADRIKLVTIYNIEESPVAGMVQLIADPLDDDQIQEIFTSNQYNVPEEDARRLAQLCSGSPRVAHIIAEDVTRTGNVNVTSRADIWMRYVAGADRNNSDAYRKRLAVLKWIALFRRFGYARPLNQEGDTIAKKISQSEGITDGEFRAIISDLRQRKILQGDVTLYITPKLLHIWLWKLWWDDHGESFDLEKFIQVDEGVRFSDQLIDWFFDMLQYARESTVVPKIVEDLLSSQGIMGESDFLDSERGSKLIRILAGVDQEVVLKFIESKLESMTPDELRSFRAGRRGVINALEVIAVLPQYFERSAEVLLKLAVAENETWANNATGVFAGLFSNGPGRVAPTGASPEQRIPVLERAARSKDPVKQKVIVSAMSQGLEAAHFTRIVGAEYSGIIEKAELWRPQTYDELWDAYRRIWKLAFVSLREFTEENRKELARTMITHLRGLILHLGIKDEVVEWISDLVDDEHVDNREIIKEIVVILRYDKKDLPKTIVTRLEALQERLIGSGYADLIRRYVGLNIIEDEYDAGGNHTNSLTEKVESLAKQSVDNPAAFKEMLPWLVSGEPENSYSFGVHLGKLDISMNLLDLIIEAEKRAPENNRSVHLLAGYLQSVRQRDEMKWEILLDKLAQYDSLQEFVPEITWRSGMSDRAIRRIISLSKRGLVDDSVFRMFGYGSSLDPLSKEAFEELVEYLLTSRYEQMDSIVLDYAAFYYEMKNKAIIPEELGFKILTQPTLFKENKASQRNQMDDYYWHQVAQIYLTTYPSRALDLAKIVLSNFGAEGSITDGYKSYTDVILNRLVQIDPKGVWDLVSPHIRPAKDMIDWNLTRWFMGQNISFIEGEESEAPINLLPRELLWSWIDEDIENRARMVAHYIPKQLLYEDGEMSLAREFLAKYGGNTEVRRAFTVNNYNEGWSGERSAHYANKLKRLEGFRKKEDNVNVIQWIDEYMAALKKEIVQARIEEERDD